MKTILFVLGLIVASTANAGVAKINWSFNNRTWNGNPVTVTQFRIYMAPQGQPLSQIINLGPPAPMPWKVENGNGIYAKTYDRPEWTAGSTWCFQMTAFAASEESGRSNTVCKTFPEAPDEPVIIDIVAP